MQVKGSTVFVTGANRGLGLAFAREAVQRGAAKVYGGMRNVSGFKEPGITPVAIDVTDAASVKAAAAAAKDVTLLVNNAGIARILTDALDENVETLSREILETNYYGIIRTTQAFAPSLIRNGKSGIINVLSDVSWVPVARLTPYAASKAAAWSYTNNARLSFKAHNIPVLGLHVGFIDTDLTKAVTLRKSAPADVVRITYDAFEAGESEVSADESTRALKQSLSQKNPGYIDPSPIDAIKAKA